MKMVSIILGLLVNFNFALAGELEDVKAFVYASQQGADCDQDSGWWGSQEPAQKIDVKYKNEWSENEETATFYTVLCYGGAYNFSYLVVEKNEFVPGGLKILSFAQPDVDFEFEKKYSEELEFEVEVVKDWKLVGMSTTEILGSPVYDETTKTLVTFYKGRGVGDAFDSQTYTFKNGYWSLTKSVMDPSFDGEITPITVFGK